MRTSLLEGARIARLDRRGKQMALIAEGGGGVIVHLGMSGRMTLANEREALLPHTHVVWTIARAAQEYTQVRFVDPRRFGALVTFAHAEALQMIWNDVGPDALALARSDPLGHAARTEVATRIRATTRAIKPTLLDQGVVAGVGNIYADEACFAARVDPHRPGSTLTPGEISALLDAVPRVLTSAIECGGTTLRDYADALGGRGAAQARHAVYGRAGEACLVCRGDLAADRLGQRATVWCPRCQR